jgi:hypothetical protein
MMRWILLLLVAILITLLGVWGPALVALGALLVYLGVAAAVGAPLVLLALLTEWRKDRRQARLLERRRSGCHCQRYGKSGVPHVETFRCLVCGEPVDTGRPFVCPAYRPDHHGECLTCDEPADAHTYAAHALGSAPRG